MILGSLPIEAAASRIAARSTSSGTTVKSCNTMRATTNGISSVRAAFGFQLDAYRNGQARNPAKPGGLQSGQRIQRAGFAAGKAERPASVEQVMRHDRGSE